MFPKPVEAQLVALTKTTVICSELLNCVISKVHKWVGDVLSILLIHFATQPQVALFEEMAVHVMSQENPDTNVKLPPIDQVGIFKILLNDEGIGPDDGGHLGQMPDVVIGILLRLVETGVF